MDVLKWGFLGLVFLAGCDGVQSVRLPDAYVDGYVYAMTGATTVGKEDTPTPDDKPKPGEPCPTCRGTGKVGDGIIFNDCLDCDGTGKVPALTAAGVYRSVTSATVCGPNGCYQTQQPADRSRRVQVQRRSGPFRRLFGR